MTNSPSDGESCATAGGGINPPGQPAKPAREHRLHKPGVAGSSPAAASSGTTLLNFHEPIDQYHADKAWWSKSQLWDLAEHGPAFFKGRHLDGTIKGPFSDALSKGTLVHLWADIGHDAWWSRVRQVPPEFIGLNGAILKKGEDWVASQPPGSLILKPAEVTAYLAQFAAIRANAIYQSLSRDTEHREFSIRWQCPETGLNLRCRPDAATQAVIWDIKTTKEVNPLKTFWKSVIDYGYHFQASLYMAGARAAGLPATQFLFLVTSTAAPYECHAVVLPSALVAAADKQVRQTCVDLRARLAMDDWSHPDADAVTQLWFPARYMEDESYDPARRFGGRHQ